MQDHHLQTRRDPSQSRMCASPVQYLQRRQCSTCSVQQGLQVHLRSLESVMENQTSWYQWESVQVTNKKTGEDQSKKLLVAHSTTVQQLVDVLISSTEQFAAHIFEANWQYKQFTALKDNLPEGVVLCVLDFAENYTARAQDEVQSAHWAQTQITIHLVVCYDGNIVHEMVFVSDDIKHRAHFVEKCVSDAVSLLRDAYNVQFTKMVQFTDGCSSQYKSKVPFMDISA